MDDEKVPVTGPKRLRTLVLSAVVAVSDVQALRAQPTLQLIDIRATLAGAIPIGEE
jgi:hypothetical protein